jgi:hypothetical protein
MNKSVVALGAVFLLAGCVTPEGPYTGQSGTVRGAPATDYRGAAPENLLIGGCDELIPIIADNARDGYARENAWVARRYPNAQVIGQRGTSCGDKRVDIVTIEESDGTRRELFFDISSFFGKTGGDDLDDLLAK